MNVKALVRPRFSLFLLLGLLLALMLAPAARAAVTTDQADYAPGSVVTISGNNVGLTDPWTPGDTVTVNVVGPYDFQFAPITATVGLDGAWSCSFMLSDNAAVAVGAYTYTARAASSFETQSGSFTDAKYLTITGAVASSRTYNGTTTATVTGGTLVGVSKGHANVAIGTYTATFADANVGNSKAVTVTAVTLTGSDASWYDGVSPLPSGLTANITAKTLTGHFTAADKVYDGNTSASILTRTLTGGIVGNEVVSLTGGSASFATAAVGTGKTVTGTGFTLTGADAGNYDLASTTLTTSADITPALTAIGDATVNEGSLWSGSGQVTDPGADTLSGTVNYGDGTTTDLVLGGDGKFTLSHTYADGPANYTVTVTAKDSDGAEATPVKIAVHVNNVAPDITSVTAGLDPVALRNPVTAIVKFTDPGVLDAGTVRWNWDDGSFSSSSWTMTSESGKWSSTATHTYTTAGVYSISVTVTDKDGASDTDTVSTWVVIYDPSGGFVTGGGWIMSPTGAYAADPTMTGKATFGFVSKYLKGATVPTGETEFQFHAASMNFNSTSYQWLVIAGAKAQYKGVGTVNGASGYSFMLTATDGQTSGGGGVDRFRMKIWNTATGDMVYDNMMGSLDTDNPTTAISGGSIVLHK